MQPAEKSVNFLNFTERRKQGRKEGGKESERTKNFSVCLDVTSFGHFSIFMLRLPTGQKCSSVKRGFLVLSSIFLVISDFIYTKFRV